jgi:sec-independent protein translocase protein TatA
MKKLPRLNPHTTYVLGFTEILLIALVLVFFFGAKRIPEIAKGLGGGIKSFKSELKEPDDRGPPGGAGGGRLPPADGDAPRD